MIDRFFDLSNQILFVSLKKDYGPALMLIFKMEMSMLKSSKWLLDSLYRAWDIEEQFGSKTWPQNFVTWELRLAHIRVSHILESFDNSNARAQTI